MKRDLVNTALGQNLIPRQARWRILKVWGVKINGPVAIEPRCWFGAPHITLGTDVYINSHVLFDSNGGVVIGDRVRIGPRVNFVTSSHEIGPSAQRCGNFFTKSISVGAGTWIGAGVTILPGVAIGDGCVIGAGALVTQNCEPNGVYLGVPARRVKELSQAD